MAQRSDLPMRPALPARLGIVAALLYSALYLAVWLARDTRPRFGDFFAFWSFGRFALDADVPRIYDPAVLQRFQHALEPAFGAAYPFFYPPSMLLVLAPLARLPFPVAWAGWSLTGLAFYLLASGAGIRSWQGAALLAAPTTLLCLISGQNGLFAAALLLGGLRTVPSRPWLGGAVLGLLTLKPQLGLLLPLALVAAGQWRAVAAASLCAGSVVLATGCMFGWQAWAAWAQSLPLDAALLTRNRSLVVQLMPTVSAGLYQLGVPDGPAGALQAAAVALSAFATWRAFRSGVTADAIAVLALATFLATPYAYLYDLPVVTGALVFLLPDRPNLGPATVFVTIVPLLMPYAGVPLAEPLFLVIAWFLIRRPASAAGHRMVAA